MLGLLNSLPGAFAQGLIWGIMALGVFITYRLQNIADLTVDGSFALGGAVCVMLIRAGVNPVLALIFAFLSGALAGMITSLLHTKCGIPAILSGILTQLALFSINLRVMGGRSNQPISVDKYSLVLSQRYVTEFSFRNPILLLLILSALIVALLYWFFGTERGSSIRVTGANKNMARAQGINTDLDITIGLMLSNALVSLSGALFSQYSGSSDVNMGRGAIVIGLAAVIIGEVLFGKIKHNFAGTLSFIVLGSVVYYLVIQITLQLGLSTNDLKLISALIVALFLSFPYWKSKINFGGKKRVKNK